MIAASCIPFAGTPRAMVREPATVIRLAASKRTLNPKLCPKPYRGPFAGFGVAGFGKIWEWSLHFRDSSNNRKGVIRVSSRGVARELVLAFFLFGFSVFGCFGGVPWSHTHLA